MTWRLLVAVVAIRLAVLVTGLIATVTIDNAVPEHQQQPETALRELPNRWDTGWYISIASRGYTYRGTGEIKDHNVAFFPAYPLAVGTVARVLRIPRTPAAWAWVGVVLSMLAFCGASVFLYRLAAPYGEDVAALTVTLVAAYPFALFFGAVYTESFFLLGCTAALWCASQQRVVGALLWGVFTGLVRPNGFLLAVPLLLLFVVNARHKSEAGPRLLWLSAVGPVAGHALYAAYLWSLSGDPFLWVSAQKGWGRAYLGVTGAAVEIASGIQQLGLVGFVAHRPYDTANAVAGLVAATLVIPVWRRFGIAMAAFVALNLLPPVMVGGLISLGRFTSVLFPMHLWLATATPPSWRPSLVAIFGVLQGLLAVLHYTSRAVH